MPVVKQPVKRDPFNETLGDIACAAFFDWQP